MKRIIFIKIFILAFCFTNFGQNENQIPKRIGEPVDSFARSTRDDLKARMDIFQIALNAYPNAEGFIVIEFVKNTKRKNKVDWLKSFEGFFVFRKADKTRYTFLISESSFNESANDLTTLWIVPAGAKFEPDSIKRNIIKGENLRQAINTIFKKN